VDIVLSEVKVDEIKVDTDTEDDDNTVEKEMMKTWYSAALDKGAGSTKAGETKFQCAVTDETEAVKALAQALDAPVMGVLKIADYEVHTGNFKTWFELGLFPFSLPKML